MPFTLSVIYFYFGALHLLLALAYVITNCRLLSLLQAYQLFLQSRRSIKLVTAVYSCTLIIRACYDAFVLTLLNFPS